MIDIWGYFHLLVPMNNATINIYVQVSVWTHVFISVWIYAVISLGYTLILVEMLGHMVTLC